jgi:uncharacterized membrane protein
VKIPILTTLRGMPGEIIRPYPQFSERDGDRSKTGFNGKPLRKNRRLGGETSDSASFWYDPFCRRLQTLRFAALNFPLEIPMKANVIRFALLVTLALLVGTMFGIWVGSNPAGLSASAYIEHQQAMIRAFNSLLPAMGAACILLTVTLAWISKGDPRTQVLLLTAASLLIVAALVTRFANQPINAVVMTWNAQTAPENWMQLRDEWWQWHMTRSSAGIAALLLIVAAVLGSRSGHERK